MDEDSPLGIILAVLRYHSMFISPGYTGGIMANWPTHSSHQ